MQPGLSSQEAQWSSTLLAIVMAALVAVLLLMAAVPPVDRDGLTHHLAVPKIYLQRGGMVELPSVPFSYYPMNLDLLYWVPLYLNNDILPKYIHLAFGLLTMGLIYRYLLDRLKHRGIAWLGALLFLSLPVIIRLSITAYVDLGLIFFSTAALLKLFDWADRGFRPSLLAASGILAGLCLGTKPNGMLAVFLIALCVPLLYNRPGLRGPSPGARGAHLQKGFQEIWPMTRWTLLFTATALVVFSPWMIRNAVWTGNPVYPMAGRIFGTGSAEEHPPESTDTEPGSTALDSDRNPSEGPGLGPFLIRKFVFGESLLEILLLPLRIFFQGEDGNPRLFDGRLNPYLLIFPLAAFWRGFRRTRPARLRLEMDVLAGFSLFYLLFAYFLTDLRTRYVAPILPPLAILSAVGAQDLYDAARRLIPSAKRRVALVGLGLVVCGLLGLNAQYLSGLFHEVDPLSYLNGTLPREDYIQKHRPEYAAICFANRNLPEKARILALFNGNRIYYSDREMISGTQLFAQWADDAKNLSEFQIQLDRARISHLLVGIEKFNPWANQRFDGPKKEMLNVFFQDRIEELFQKGGFALYRIIPGSNVNG